LSESAPHKAPKIGIISLGCPKALVDSERILTRLHAEGYEIAGTYEGADVVIVDICGFLDSAKCESILKISEGCNHDCSFCIIPSLRGRLASRPLAGVLAEAER